MPSVFRLQRWPRASFSSNLPIASSTMTRHFSFCRTGAPCFKIRLDTSTEGLSWTKHSESILGKNSFEITNYTGADHDSVFHFWMYFSPQVMPFHLSAGLYGDVWSMYPLLKIRNLTHNTFSLENEIIFYGKEKDLFLIGFFLWAREKLCRQCFQTAGKILSGLPIYFT